MPPTQPPVAAAVRRRVPPWVWAVLAGANVTYGVVQSTGPQRALDLQTMSYWTGDWLLNGVDLYRSLPGPDYPPHAIVALSPLALLPPRGVLVIWACINMALLAAAPVLAARFANRRAAAADIVLLALMFVCWSGAKMLLQFTLLTLVLGLAAVLIADRRPVWSGVCLGFALMKPHVTAPFLLWTLFSRRWRIAVVAAASIAAGTLVYCLRVHASPVDVAVNYASGLGLLYGGAHAMAGASELRPLLASLAQPPALDVVSVIAAAALLGVVCAVAAREIGAAGGVKYAAPALAGVWSLIAFYNLTYGFVILLPAAALLLLDDDAATARPRLAALAVLQIGLMVDLPGLSRRVKAIAPAFAPFDAALAHADRLLMFAQFGALVALGTFHVRHRG